MRVKQVHGNVVRVLKRGQVPEPAHTQRPDGDAIVSNEPGLALAVMVADCVPILVVRSRSRRRRGDSCRLARHLRARRAGRRSRRCSGSSARDPADLIAAIGPSVGPDDYQVGESLIAAFREAGHPQASVDRWFIRRGDKAASRSLGRQQRSADRCRASARERISLCGLSTVSHPDIFDSYRVEGERAGRMAGIIVVPRLHRQAR